MYFFLIEKVLYIDNGVIKIENGDYIEKRVVL